MASDNLSGQCSWRMLGVRRPQMSQSIENGKDATPYFPKQVPLVVSGLETLGNLGEALGSRAVHILSQPTVIVPDPLCPAFPIAPLILTSPDGLFLSLRGTALGFPLWIIF